MGYVINNFDAYTMICFKDDGSFEGGTVESPVMDFDFEGNWWTADDINLVIRFAQNSDPIRCRFELASLGRLLVLEKCRTASSDSTLTGTWRKADDPSKQ